MKNKQEEITESIHQGINRSIDDVAKSFLVAIIIVVIFISIIVIYAKIHNNKWEKENCGEEGCPTIPIAVSSIDNCVFDKLDCIVVDDSMINYEDESGGRLPIIQEISNVCGYQEANAWFEQYKHKINGGEELYLECS